jgi:uncharacterized protein YebE (UPF0316 family)
MEILLLCIKIFFVRVFDVALGTVRMLFTVKGKRFVASTIGFIEMLIWFLIVKEALNTDLTSIWIAVSYAGGYALGTLLGSYLSERLISGMVTVQAILSSANDEVVTMIRKAGYAVSVLDVKGQDDIPKYLLLIEVNKKRQNAIRKLIKELDDRAFVIINDSKTVYNGYFQ